jgi:bifunctional non-homologous end joining protein LigD
MGLVRAPIVFYAFDLLRLNGKDLQGLPIEERKAKLEALLKKPPSVIRYSISFTKNIDELLSRVSRLGLEGLIDKHTNSRYEAGKRTGAWVKLKLHKEQELIIGGYPTPGATFITIWQRSLVPFLDGFTALWLLVYLG